VKVSIVLAVVGTLLVAGACGTGGDDGAEATTVGDLTGTSWVLETLPGDAVPEAESTLSFAEDAQAFGSTGCNRFTATWQQDGAALTLQLGAVTQMACSPSLADQEQAVLSALADVATAEAGEQSLSLLDSSGAQLLLYAAGVSDLAGTAWTATGVNNQAGGVESTALTETATAEFAEDGTLGGFTGCRGFTAQWQASDGTISITDVTTDGPECDGDEAALEQNYLAALSNAATFAIEGSTLNLRDSDGATQVDYARDDR
jgi:heat shock protein HslJ